jgi:hypothetical protein
LPAAAEIRPVTQSVKPKPPPRKRAPARRAAATPPPPEPTPAVPGTPAHTPALLAFALVLCAAVAASLLLLGRNGEPTAASAPAAAAITPTELAARAAELDTPVFWAGVLPGRTLELTSSPSGSFVRYLPAGTPVGSGEKTLTIATYPMADAYATAVRRAAEKDMTSRRTRDGGLAVWSSTRPTSVYVAWRGVPSLVEVYAPRAAEARAVALGGTVNPVR